jgi:hypothetical protein
MFNVEEQEAAKDIFNQISSRHNLFDAGVSAKIFYVKQGKLFFG